MCYSSSIDQPVTKNKKTETAKLLIVGWRKGVIVGPTTVIPSHLVEEIILPVTAIFFARFRQRGFGHCADCSVGLAAFFCPPSLVVRLLFSIMSPPVAPTFS